MKAKTIFLLSIGMILISLGFIYGIDLEIGNESFVSSVALDEQKESPIDPLESMAIHPSGGQGKNGGRFGCSRIWGKNESGTQGTKKPHRGLDLVANNAPFKTIYSGTIVKLERDPNKLKQHGILITIKSPQNGVSIKYIHLSSVNPNLKIGQTVKQGDVIGVTGSTGAAQGNAHLHIEVSPTHNFKDNCWLEREDPEKHLATSFSPPNPNPPLENCNCHKCKTANCD